MPPRGFTLPSAKTDSARAARSAFFCTLCQKGYSRQNEFEAHETSYDHQHKKRLKEMKEMQRQAAPAGSGKKRDDGVGGGGGGGGVMVSVKLGDNNNNNKKKTGSGGAGFKKGGFKNAFAPPEDTKAADADVPMTKDEAEMRPPAADNESDDSDLTDQDQDDYYDPTRPTDCHAGCTARLSTATVGS